MSAHSHGQRSPGYSPGDRKELDMTEQLSMHTCCAMTRHTQCPNQRGLTRTEFTLHCTLTCMQVA